MFSSFDIARFSDVVYSEVLSLDQFSKLDLTDPYLIVKNDDLIFYKQKNFVIKGGDIIFTHTGNLDNLFYHLKTLDEKFQLTLITHQSDTMINKNTLKKYLATMIKKGDITMHGKGKNTWYCAS